MLKKINPESPTKNNTLLALGGVMTLCVSFMFPIDRFIFFLKIYLWETCFLCFKQIKKHLSCFKKINFEKNQKIIYGKPERKT